jgi:hypothetical protein
MRRLASKGEKIMSKRTLVAAAMAWALLMSAAPMANAQTYTPCSAKTWPGLTFGPGAPTYAIGATGGKCYCGVWTGVSPQQAVDQGWYASCNNGKGICNFAPGTRASNQVCGPF